MGGIVDQIATMVGIRLMAAANLEGQRALAAFTENGWGATRCAWPSPLAKRSTLSEQGAQWRRRILSCSPSWSWKR
jgi:hypothetical protein